MRRFRVAMQASVVLLFSTSIAGAQQPSGPGLPALRVTLVVTPERGETPRQRVPAAVDVLTTREIESAPAETGPELLRILPGLRVLFAGPGQAPIVSSRGFFGGGEAEYVQLRVDGVPVSNVESGIADWAMLRATALTRVELLRGPASVMYGDTALGGVVQVFTEPMSSHRFTMSTSAGTWNSAAVDLAHGLPLRRAHLMATGGFLRTDGFAEHAAGRQAQGAFRALAPAAGGVLTGHAALWWHDREDQGPRSPSQLRSDRFGSAALFHGDVANTRKQIADASYRRAGGKIAYHVTAYGHRRRAHQDRTLLLIPDYGLRATRDTTTRALGISGDWKSDGAGFEWRAGGDAAYESLDTDYPVTGLPAGVITPDARAVGHRRRLAAFTGLAWMPSSRLRVVPALRYDRIVDAFSTPNADAMQDAWSPRLAATLVTGRGRSPVSVFAQASRAFKAATMDQLFDPRPLPDFRGGTLTLANRALHPQRTRALEAGAFQRRGRFDWQAVIYHVAVTDEIDFDVATFAYRNIGRSRHTGVELDVAQQLSNTIVARAAYGWTRVRALDDGGPSGQLKNIPAHRWQAGLRAQHVGISIDAQFTRTAGAFLDDGNRFALEGEAGFDARIARTFGRVRLRLDAINLFNHHADAYGFALMDPRGTAIPYVYPGAPRMLRAGLDWRF